MKIVMISRASLFSSPGGDTVQLQSTAKYLRLLGIEVDIKLANEKIHYLNYDLIHFFNIIRPSDILIHISESGLPYLVSTIYVDYSEYESKNRKGVLKLLSFMVSAYTLEYIKTIGRALLNGEKINSIEYLILGQEASIKKVMANAKCLLPNSLSEYQRLTKDFQIEKTFEVIPNAVDINTFTAFDRLKTPNYDKYKDSIICVGRIEGRKNQLNVIKAIKNTSFRLFIIGKPSPNNIKYYEACRKEAENTTNIYFEEHLAQNELVFIYNQAKVHVLASWFETTGLVSLEAALCGCNIVVTAKGDTEEYFKNYAYFCNPANINSINEAITKAYYADFDNDFKETILKKYTWQVAAHKTLEAYTKVLKTKI